LKAILTLSFEAIINDEDEEYYKICTNEYDQNALFNKFDIEYSIPVEATIKFKKE